jgi:hypothetical protein
VHLLLQVFLHFLDRPGTRSSGVVTELASSITLPQQIPALVQLLLELAPSVGGVGVPGEGVLLVDQGLDAGEDVFVGHVRSLPRTTAHVHVSPAGPVDPAE